MYCRGVCRLAWVLHPTLLLIPELPNLFLSHRKHASPVMCNCQLLSLHHKRSVLRASRVESRCHRVGSKRSMGGQGQGQGCKVVTYVCCSSHVSCSLELSRQSQPQSQRHLHSLQHPPLYTLYIIHARPTTLPSYHIIQPTLISHHCSY